MDDNTAIRLYNTLKSINAPKKRDNFLIGTVVTVAPLSIDIGHGIILSEEFLFLGQACRPHKVKIPHTHIVDTFFSEKSPSIGSVGYGLIKGTAFEQSQSASAKSKMVGYSVLSEEESTAGEEKQMQISEAELGRGKVESSIIVTGQATVTDDSVMITDNGHKHIIPRQITKDVHFPKSEYATSVEICIEPALSIGDSVILFAFNDFQMFYVAERVEKA